MILGNQLVSSESSKSIVNNAQLQVVNDARAAPALENLPTFPQVLAYLSNDDVANLRLCNRALNERVVKDDAWFQHVHTLWVK